MATRKKILVGALICLSALLLATVLSGAVNTAERRAFRVHGDATVLIDWANPQTDSDGRPFVPWTLTASQTCTEGWYTNRGAGVLYLDTLIAEGSGVCCGCNGETMTWDSFEEFDKRHVAVSITGGQGWFEAVTGQFTFDYTPLTSELDEDGNPVKLTYSFWGAGEMIYRY